MICKGEKQYNSDISKLPYWCNGETLIVILNMEVNAQKEMRKRGAFLWLKPTCSKKRWGFIFTDSFRPSGSIDMIITGMCLTVTDEKG